MVQCGRRDVRKKKKKKKKKNMWLGECGWMLYLGEEEQEDQEEEEEKEE